MEKRDVRRLALATLSLACACGPSTPKPRTVVVEPPQALETDPRAGAHLCAAMPMLSASPKPKDPSTATVVRVDTRGYSQPEKLCAYIRTRPGAPINNVVVDRDVRDLWDTGFYDDVDVWRETVPGGVALSFVVKERGSFASVRLDGVRGIDGVDAKLLPSPGLLDPRQLHKVRLAIEDELVSSGYRHADVSYRPERREDGATELVFNVEAHAQTLVGKLTFHGLQRMKQADLLSAVRTLPGTPLSKPMLDRDVLVIQAAYYDRGMLMIQVDEPSIVESASGDSASVTIEVREGDVYRLGAVHVVGDLIQPESEYLKSFWSSKPNDVFSRGIIVSDVERVKDYQRARGFESTVEPETVINNDKKTVDVTLKIAPLERR